MTLEEFGKTIKSKYPQYNDIPDAELGQKMLTKYPQYKDMVSVGAPTTSTDTGFSFGKMISNIPSSAFGVAKGIGEAVLHPIQTAKAIGGTVVGGAEKLIPGVQPQEKYFDAMTDYVKGRYGSVNNLLQTIQNDPVGFATDLSVVLGGGETALTKAGEFAKLPGLIKAGETAGKIGEVVDPLRAAGKATTGAVKMATGLLEKAKTPETLESLAGKITQPSKVALKSPSTIPTTVRALQQIDTTGIKTFEDLSKRFQSTTNDILKEVDKRFETPKTTQKNTITLYRAAPNFPTDNFKKGTYFADNSDKASYYSSSHYIGDPSDIKVKQFTLPKDSVFKEPSTGNYILKEDAPVKIATFTPEDLTKEITSGKEVIKQNYVDEMISGLKELYQKVKEPANQAEIIELENKYKIEGLTAKEINDLAKKYGTEFGQKAFGKTGEPLTSVNSRAFENIRIGGKETARELMPDENTRALDKQASDLIRTKQLVDNLNRNLKVFEDKMRTAGLLRTIGRRIGTILGTAVDITSGGVAKGILRALLGLKGGEGTLNIIELQRNLPKYLDAFDKLNSVQPEQAVQMINAGFLDPLLKTAYYGQQIANPPTSATNQPSVPSSTPPVSQ